MESIDEVPSDGLVPNIAANQPECDVGAPLPDIRLLELIGALEDDDRFYKITLIPDDGSEEVVIDKISKRQRLRVFKHDDGSERLLSDGDHVEVGQQLMEGAADPHEVLRVQGPREVQIHLVREVQEVYRAQGVSIHDKHI